MGIDEGAVMLALMATPGWPDEPHCQQAGCGAIATYVIGDMSPAGLLSQAQLLCYAHAQTAFDVLVAEQCAIGQQNAMSSYTIHQPLVHADAPKQGEA